MNALKSLELFVLKTRVVSIFSALMNVNVWTDMKVMLTGKVVD